MKISVIRMALVVFLFPLLGCFALRLPADLWSLARVVNLA